MSASVLSLEPCPKKEIIIFKNTKPSIGEACDSIRHFCREHGETCKKVFCQNSLHYQINGTMYKVSICMSDPQDPSDGWMIRCRRQKSNTKQTYTGKGMKLS